MLAGHEESGGTVVEENGEKFMLFYGMSSESAMTVTWVALQNTVRQKAKP